MRLNGTHANPDPVEMAEIAQLTIPKAPSFVPARLVLLDCSVDATLTIVERLSVSKIPSVLI